MYDLKCDHLWFYGVPHCQLQREFGDLIQGDWNHVEISCKIYHWSSRNGKYVPVFARIGVHVENTRLCLPVFISVPNFHDPTSQSDPVLKTVGTSTKKVLGFNHVLQLFTSGDLVMVPQRDFLPGALISSSKIHFGVFV